MSQSLDRVLGAARQLGASDVHLKAGLPPIFRIRGDLRTTPEVPVLSRDQIAELAVQMMNDRQRTDFEQHQDLDLAYSTPDGVRCRASLFQQRGSIGMVLRLIPPDVPPFDRLNLPQAVLDLAAQPSGLVLVTGAAGAGKSTTLAAMIEHINTQRACHILTVEDPIEFAFRDRRSVVSQRELGADTPTFSRALRASLRQDPDVILVGELRDLETAELALTAARTGHLVLSALPAADATDAVSRVLALFPAHRQAEARRTLAGVLRGVVAQRLLARADGNGMVPALEIAISGRETITFDQSLANLARQRLVTYEAAAQETTNPSHFASLFRGVPSTHRTWANGLAVVDANPGARHDEIEIETEGK
jgi:twitching motility protein PilT